MEKKVMIVQLIFCLLTVTSLVGPGMMMGYSGVILPLLTNTSTYNTIVLEGSTQTWFASITTISTPIGCLMSLYTMNHGRRFAMILAGVVCSVGWCLIAISRTVPELLLGRFINGLSGGLISTPGSVYLAEISSLELNTVLTPATSLFISFGSMLVYLLALVFQDWRLVAMISIFVPLVSALLIFVFLPESPRWLLSKGLKEEAKSSLLRLRGLKSENRAFSDEFSAMILYSEFKYNPTVATVESTSALDLKRNRAMVLSDPAANPSAHIQLNKKPEGKFDSWIKVLKIPQVWKPLLIINVFFIGQQFCGLYVILAYSVDFLERIGVDSPEEVSVVLGLVQMASCFILILCSDKLGRRPIAISSGAGMSISFLILAIYHQIFPDQQNHWLPLLCIIFYELSGSFGFWTLPWAMFGEIYPTKYVNYLGPVTTLMAGVYNFASIQLYPTLSNFNTLTTLYVYCSVCIFSTIFVIIYLPETRGKTKAEIEKQF